MGFCSAFVGLFFALMGVAHATTLRVSAEPPLSGERLGDALRSYLDGTEVMVEPLPSATEQGEAVPADHGMASVTLRKGRGPGEDAEVVLVDGEETVFARLPGAFRKEDLYRAAALKVQALLQRRAAAEIPVPRAGDVRQGPAQPEPARRVGVMLDAGLAFMVPSQGPSREGLRLGAALGLGGRFRLGLGAYLEPPRSTTSQGINVSAWELPLFLSLGFAWHQGWWQGWLEGVGHAALRRISAEAAGIVSRSDTTLSPRAGGAMRFALAVAPMLRAEARISMLATLADTRYRVDGQVVSPSASSLVMIEVGLEYGGR